MKKILSISLLLALTVSLAACSSKETSKSTEAPKSSSVYKDGTYSAEGDKWDFGFENASVVIKNNKIEKIDLKRLDKEGKEIDYVAYNKNGGPDLTKAKEALTKNILEKQTFKVDSVTGATVSSKNWKVAVERALDKASK